MKRTVFIPLLFLLLIWPGSAAFVFAQQGSPSSGSLGATAKTVSLEPSSPPEDSLKMPVEETKSYVKVLKDISESNWLKPIETEKGFIALVEGRSHLLRFRKKIKRISVSDPEIVDFAILNSTEVLLNAKKQGAINVIAWDQDDRISIFDVSVTKDPSVLYELLKKIDPQGIFEVYPSKDLFVVRGEVTSERQLRQVQEAANAFAEGSVALVRVREAQQILLKTRFVQLDRNRDYDFGIDIENGDQIDGSAALFQRFLPGQTTKSTENDSTVTIRANQDTVTSEIFDRVTNEIYGISYFEDNSYFQAFLDALETKGITKTIARPNLLVKDGEEATFLVGGEAAVLVQTGNNIQVQYREFGTRLTFTPQILHNGKIRLTVEPEVSTLNNSFGVTTTDSQIPGFSTTRVRTVVELRDGETYAIGGLLQQKLTRTDSGFPFLKRIPLIGKLFSSIDEDWDVTELIVTVTPHVVQPETEPLGEGEDPRDILSIATRLGPTPVSDPHADAIHYYWRTQKRFLDPQWQHFESGDQSGDQIVQVTPPLDSKTLDELEAKLQWKA